MSGYFWSRYSQVIRASPRVLGSLSWAWGVNATRPLQKGRQVRPVRTDTGPLRLWDMCLSQESEILYYYYLGGERTEKKTTQKTKTLRLKKRPIHKERWHEDDVDDGCNINRRLTVKWHDVVGSGMMKVKAHSSCQGKTR